MNKIAIISFYLEMLPRPKTSGRDRFANFKLFRKERHELIGHLLSDANKAGCTHALFPGWTFVYGENENVSQLKEDLRKIQKLSKALEISIIGEFTILPNRKNVEFTPAPAPYGIYAFEKGKIINTEIRQQFATSPQAGGNPKYGGRPSEAYKKVVGDIFSKKRIITIGGLNFLILVCGETNILYNSKDMKQPRFRFNLEIGLEKKLRSLPHHIVFNPGHTEFSNFTLGLFKKRWRFLSKGKPNYISRVVFCIYTTNITESNCSFDKGTYIYKNGGSQSASESEERKISEGNYVQAVWLGILECA
ncbi:MAG: hypothetical protein G3M70_11085 [Candidatus Nitronauta litoralis]|uniref:CN hydrolase domain-containing protein n=1 Tax=Candidatus Nitronauta litoralis TaxID=2705533 RepID=A0A7T0BWY5_9BACT|nr:MAG: hypothetical protein G3M70_11085 [Candidatus Nitronauta litoralis]